MADLRQDIVVRFGIVYTIVCLTFILVVYKIVVIQTVERKNWLALSSKNIKTDIVVKPTRGNIYACDGRLMASSIPSYYVYLDLRVPALHENNGKLFKDNIDSLSLGLAEFFQDRTADEYKKIISNAYRSKRASLQLFPKRISYAQYKDLKRLPLLRLSRNKSGLIVKEFFSRVKPFGSLASRTIGDIYPDEKKGGKNGLELYFNTQLIGIPGVSIRHKIANKYLETVQVEPVDGMDINTTIDIDLQDITEKALLDGVREFDAATACAILMETKSGEVKSIVNMTRNEDGSYTENRNGAVSDLTEPGSTFKVASIMAALDDGKVKLTDTIDTKNGQYIFGNRVMTDHNANRGGFHKITLAQAIYGSSNIGISRSIVKAYGKNPAAFVDKLYEMKLNEAMNIELPGAAAPVIKHPSDKTHEWSNTTLPWMSVGYETQIPPIYTLAFYNAIANDGKLIRPYFVKSISQNGLVVKEFSTEVINAAICKPSTLTDVRSALLGVVEDKMGTATNVRSNYVRIAGKSGTAQISQGKGGYKAGVTKHQVTFCGFFPFENPMYTCVVVMREPGIGHASGGHMSGSVFKNIAERVMAVRSDRKAPSLEIDSLRTTPLKPYVKAGYGNALLSVTKQLNIPLSGTSAEWISAEPNDNTVEIQPTSLSIKKMPNLHGMGAKDALFLLEKMGLRTQVTGRGKVVSQSIMAGSRCTKGKEIRIILE